MNTKIKKTRDELERTKAKIAELQALVPQIERNITDMENTEISRLVRSANIPLDDFAAFIAELKKAGTAAPEPVRINTTAQDNPRGNSFGSVSTDDDEEDENNV